MKCLKFFNPKIVVLVLTKLCTFGFPEGGAVAPRHVGILCVKYDFYSFYVRLLVTVLTRNLKDKARSL